MAPSPTPPKPPALPKKAQFACKQAKSRGYPEGDRQGSRHQARKGKREPIPIVYEGQIFPSRGAMAKHLAPILGKSAVTLARALLNAGDDAEAVVRRYRPEEPEPRVKTLSHDEIATRFLRERLAKGPVATAIVDDEVERGRLCAGSVEKAKAELGLVARRVNNGRGAVVHLCTADQAAELEA